MNVMGGPPAESALSGESEMTLRSCPIAVLFVSVANAQTVLTFDDLGLRHGTIITNQYVGQGVLFSPLNGQLELRTATVPVFPGDPMGLAEIPYFESVIIVDFLPGATSAGAWIDFGDGPSPDVMLEAFDGPGGTGNLLGSISTTTESFLGLELIGIKSVRFESAPNGTSAFLIDHFTFTLVPGPGTLSLFALGGLIVARRRR